MSQERIRPVDIDIAERHRTPGAENIETLAKSIDEIGLQSPILVRLVEDVEIDGLKYANL